MLTLGRSSCMFVIRPQMGTSYTAWTRCAQGHNRWLTLRHNACAWNSASTSSRPHLPQAHSQWRCAAQCDWISCIAEKEKKGDGPTEQTSCQYRLNSHQLGSGPKHPVPDDQIKAVTANKVADQGGHYASWLLRGDDVIERAIADGGRMSLVYFHF